MTGSSPLTPEQTAWYEEHFGIRFVTVAENHLRPSRRERRHGQNADLYRARQRAIKQLRSASVRPVLMETENAVR